MKKWINSNIELFFKSSIKHLILNALVVFAFFAFQTVTAQVTESVTNSTEIVSSTPLKDIHSTSNNKK